jgi:hypothetical protein
MDDVVLPKGLLVLESEPVSPKEVEEIRELWKEQSKKKPLSEEQSEAIIDELNKNWRPM